MATRVATGLLLLCASPMRPGPRPSPERDRPVPRPLRSLRLRHPTKWPLRRRPHDTPSPSVRCASLSTCTAPLARTAAARPMRRPPLHPPLPATRSMRGGRSSPEPAKPTVRPSPCQGLARGHCALHSLGRDAIMNCLRSPARRSHGIHRLRELHQFTTPSLLCQVGCRESLFAPRLA